MPRNEIADARDLRWKIATVLDEATVQILALTSSPDAVIRAAYEDREGIPAYDDTPGIDPRNVLKRCGYCGLRYWQNGGTTGPKQAYCSRRCSGAASRARIAGRVA